MGTILDTETEVHIRSLFSRLSAPVTLVHFTQAHAVGACREQRALLEELCGLASGLTLEIHELEDEDPTAMRYGITTVPATAVVGNEDHGIRFYGVTGGFLLPVLVDDIVMVSTGRSGLNVEAAALAQRIAAPTRLQILMTLSCRHSSKMARLAHQLAFINENISAEIVDASEFPHLSQRHGMTNTPMTVINEVDAFEGALQPKDAVLEILKSVMPQDYQHVEERAHVGQRRLGGRRLEPGHVYDTLVVGTGAAGMTAAMYAARKNMDVAVIGQEPGGQIAGAASVENWPGTPSVAGKQLMDQFRDHMVQFGVAEGSGVDIDRIDRLEGGFVARSKSGGAYRGRTLIYCGGKQNRTLGAPGEARFLGRGIGFCTTCDAPLYRDKTVAVIGGGDSALAAARDLVSFARSIHVVHILDEFQADPRLLAEVQSSRNVTFHTSSEVVEFIGKSRLQGMRLRAVGIDQIFDLLVDGVFLEIGQEPNSQPIAGLLVRNDRKEIPVDRGQSTLVPGLFAAGDVTDNPDKQVILAAAQGAQAALSAYRYVMNARSENLNKSDDPVLKLA